MYYIDFYIKLDRFFYFVPNDDTITHFAHYIIRAALYHPTTYTYTLRRYIIPIACVYLG